MFLTSSQLTKISSGVEPNWLTVCGQLAFFKPFLDILAHHARNHQGAPHADRFGERRAEGQRLEDAIFAAEPAGKGDIGHSLAAVGQLLAELVGGGVEIEAGDTPLLHHAPGAHAGAAGRTVYGQQVDFGPRTPFDRHGQLAQAVGAGLEGNALEPEFPQPRHLFIKAFFIDEAEAAVPLELLDGAVFEGGLVNRGWRGRA